MKCLNCFVAAVSGERCANCGALLVESHRDRRALAPNCLVAGKYLIGRVLGVGGFGISYLALDQTLNRRVALKEYLPNELVSRARDGVTIFCNSSMDEEPFKRGLRRFFREGEVIAKFDHPNIVKAYEVLQANGTAYLAMEFLEGRTLKAVLEERGPFAEKEALDVMTFVMDALDVIHRRQVVHRDLKPDNVYVTNEGRTLLLDFGGAKEIVSERSQSMTAIFSHGYAAPEQYHGDEAKVGPWTDVYGCGALIYKLTTGRTPPSALERYSGDDVLNWYAVPVSPVTMSAVAGAMALKAEKRTQSVKAFQAALNADLGSTGRSVRQTEPSQPPKNWVPWAALASILLVSIGAYWYWNSTSGLDLRSVNDRTPTPAVQSTPASESKAVPAEPVPEPTPPVILPAAKAPPSEGAAAIKPSPPPIDATPSKAPNIASPQTTAAVAKPKPSAEKAKLDAERIEKEKAAELEEAVRRRDEANVSAILSEGETCFAANRFDCAISSANAVLRINPQEGRAQALRERAQAGQKRALEGIKIE